MHTYYAITMPNIRMVASYFCVHIGLRPLLSVEPKGRWAVSLLQVADEKMHQEARYSCGNHWKNDGNHSNIWAIVVFHLQPWFCMLLPARYLCKPSCNRHVILFSIHGFSCSEPWLSRLNAQKKLSRFRGI